MRRAAILLVLLGALFSPATARADFGFPPGTAGFDVATVKQNGTPENRAGIHPYALQVDLSRNLAGGSGDGDLRDLGLAMPPGFLVNPATMDACSATAFHTPRVSPYEASLSGESCPEGSQVGVVAVRSGEAGGATRYFGVFNLEAPYGSPLALGFAPYGVPIVLAGHVREADAGLSFELSDLSQGFDLQALELTLWGTPWSASHHAQRGNCLRETTGGSWGSCTVPGFSSSKALEERAKSLLTLPTACDGPMRWALGARSWQGDTASAEAQSHDAEGNPLAIAACKDAQTKAQVRLATTSAATGSGLVFDLDVDDGGGILNPDGIARPSIRTARVELPEGLTLNPSLGNGLGVCGEADFARETLGSAFGAGCPGASKIGTVEVEGMLGLSKDQSGFGAQGLAEPLTGSVFLAKPYDNRFGTLLALYMVASLPERGLFVKGTGRVELDPASGRMVASFEDLPRLLYEHFSLRFREGQRPTFVSPPSCGSYPMRMELRAWGRPTVLLQDADTFAIDRGERGGPCPAGGAPPFRPEALAGSLNPQAGAHSPFVLYMTRADADQEITSYSAQLPPGVLGAIAGIPFCSDSAIEAAKAKTGAEELQHPSCQAASSIGHTLSGYGVGTILAYAPGGLYLAGPYHGAPLSVVAVDSALIGPFDLGTIVVRSAIDVDPLSAQVRIDSAASDPIPHIRLGVPLHLRDVRVYLDRPGFMVNPTSCERFQVASTLTGSAAPFADPRGALARVDAPYRAFGCASLGYSPKLTLSSTGGARRGSYQQLEITVTPRAGDANIASAAITLPPSLFLAQNHIRAICTRPQSEADTCPPGAIVGRAEAQTPLLTEPLQGPVYLRSSGNPLPDLVTVLHGQGGIRIVLECRVDSHRAGLRGRCEGLPDAPVEKFTMTIFGGRKRGILQSAENLCRKAQPGEARLLGQANLGVALRPRLGVRCAKSRRPHKHRRRGGGGARQ